MIRVPLAALIAGLTLAACAQEGPRSSDAVGDAATAIALARAACTDGTAGDGEWTAEYDKGDWYVVTGDGAVIKVGAQGGVACEEWVIIG